MLSTILPVLFKTVPTKLKRLTPNNLAAPVSLYLGLITHNLAKKVKLLINYL